MAFWFTVRQKSCSLSSYATLNYRINTWALVGALAAEDIRGTPSEGCQRILGSGCEPSGIIQLPQTLTPPTCEVDGCVLSCMVLLLSETASFLNHIFCETLVSHERKRNYEAPTGRQFRKVGEE